MAHGIGVDFGTTNSTVALAADGGATRLATFARPGADPARVFRSILFFEADVDWVAGRPPASIGHTAIAEYLATGADGRLMQSMKSFLASRHVTKTGVHGHPFTLEALVALVVSELRRTVEGHFGLPVPPHIVAGRPVTFVYAKDDDDDAFAEARLDAAFKLAGFEDITFIPEPVAAALDYEAGLDHDEIVLVADFGGGTSDFSVLRIGPGVTDDPRSPERILGTAGVGVAGDSFDARIVDALVAPALGKGSRYRSQMGSRKEIPPTFYQKLQRWHELSILKNARNIAALRDYHKMAEHPDRIGAFIELVEADLGYALYAAVERAKVALSTQEHAAFSFDTGELAIEATLTRADFEGWIAPELDALSACVDGLFQHIGLDGRDVDTVFLTGGTALVPAVRGLFSARFGEDALRSGDFLGSVVSGLARHARRLA